jgi:hypothetical protein
MGRYYSGDIEGKFWFAVQPSDSADRFGVKGVEPSVLQYCFTSDDIEGVKNGLKEIEDNLGDKLPLMEKFFSERDMYNDAEVCNNVGISEDEVLYYLREYADYKLGNKILKELLEYGRCEFEAELY